MDNRRVYDDAAIRALVHEEMRDSLRAHTALLERQSRVLDKIADGAQAQLLSTAILHGNPELGLKGFVPDVIERLGALEARVESDGAKNDARHEDNVGRFERLEAGQHRITKTLGKCHRWLLRSNDGGVDYAKVTALATGVVGASHLVFSHMPSWATIKRVIVAVGAAWGK